MTVGAEGEGDSKVELLYRITRNRVSDPGNEDAVAAIREIGESGDGEFVVGLADIIQTPLTRNELLFNVEQVIPVMQRLSGQGIEYDGKAWVEWVAQQPGLETAGGLFRVEGGLAERYRSSIQGLLHHRGRLASLWTRRTSTWTSKFMAWGGVLQDDGSARSIPSLVEPKMVTAEEATYLENDDRVFGVSINGDSRAYPLRIMNWHEMANDVVGGVPVALAYCTLCGSGILYETEVDGRDVRVPELGAAVFQQQADVRPDDGRAVESVHRRSSDGFAGGVGGGAEGAARDPDDMGGLAGVAPRHTGTRHKHRIPAQLLFGRGAGCGVRGLFQQPGPVVPGERLR